MWYYDTNLNKKITEQEIRNILSLTIKTQDISVPQTYINNGYYPIILDDKPYYNATTHKLVEDEINGTVIDNYYVIPYSIVEMTNSEKESYNEKITIQRKLRYDAETDESTIEAMALFLLITYKNKTEFNDEFSELIDKIDIGRSLIQSELPKAIIEEN